MKTIRWLTTLVGSWWGLMSGALSIPFGAISAFCPTASQKTLFIVLAFIALMAMVVSIANKNRKLELENAEVENKFKGEFSKIDGEIESLTNDIRLLRQQLKINDEPKFLDIDLKPANSVTDTVWSRSTGKNEIKVDIIAIISNLNQAVNGIRFKLISITPLMYLWTPNTGNPMVAPFTKSTVNLNLSDFEFSFKDVKGDLLNEGDTGQIPLFHIRKHGGNVTMTILGNDKANQGAGAYNASSSHEIALQVTGIGVKPTLRKFKLDFFHNQSLVNITKLN